MSSKTASVLAYSQAIKTVCEGFASIMGNTHTIEYRTDPQTVQLMQAMSKELEDARTEAKQKGDANVFNQKKATLLQDLCDKLPTLTLSSPIPDKFGAFNTAVALGDVSTGKTSLMKLLFGIDGQIGVGDSTAAVNHFAIEDKLCLFDAPGINNNDFEFTNPATLSLFRHCTFLLIFFSTSLKTVNEIVRVANAAKGPGTRLVFVRSCIDKFGKPDERTLEEEKRLDLNMLTNPPIGIHSPLYFCTSACPQDVPVDVKPFVQNKELRELLLKK